MPTLKGLRIQPSLSEEALGSATLGQEGPPAASPHVPFPTRNASAVMLPFAYQPMIFSLFLFATCTTQ